MKDTTQWLVLYRAGKRSLRVRLLFWAGVPFSCWGLWYARALAANPADFVWAIVLAVFAVAVVAGLFVYLGLYVTEVAIENKGSQLRLQILTPTGFSSMQIPVTTVRGVKSFDGEMITDRHHVVAPWLAVSLAGRMLPLVIDMQGSVLDERRLRAVLSGKSP